MNNFRPQTLQLDTAAVACAVVRHSSAESLVLGCDDAVINEIDTNGDLCDSSNISNILLPCGQGDDLRDDIASCSDSSFVTCPEHDEDECEDKVNDADHDLVDRMHWVFICYCKKSRRCNKKRKQIENK